MNTKRVQIYKTKNQRCRKLSILEKTGRIASGSAMTFETNILSTMSIIESYINACIYMCENQLIDDAHTSMYDLTKYRKIFTGTFGLRYLNIFLKYYQFYVGLHSTNS